MYIHNPSPLTSSDPPPVPPGEPPRRTAPFGDEPGYYRESAVWLYGNARLLRCSLATIERCFGDQNRACPEILRDIEEEAEQIVLAGKVLVCGIHNDLHKAAALVPLRWGAPRILVLPGGFYHHLGTDLSQEPFRAARLWRYQWDPRTDLAISKRPPEKRPTYALHNPCIDRLIRSIGERSLPGFGGTETTTSL